MSQIDIFSRDGVIVIVINCNLVAFSKVITCNYNLDISLITVIDCKTTRSKMGVIDNYFQLLFF